LAAAGYRTHSVDNIHLRVMGLPTGTDPNTLDPAAFPESTWMWGRGKRDTLPRPYYGLQTAECTIGHGEPLEGDYTNWLRREHPDAAGILARERWTPAPSGAEGSYRLQLPPELHYNTWIADRTIAFLEEASAGARGGRPFVAFASFPDPHHPYVTPEPWFSMYDRSQVPVPVRRPGELEDLAPHFWGIYERARLVSGRRRATRMPDEHLREIVAITYGMISFVDQQIGRILDALDRLDLADDTVVHFTSDHGDLLGDHWLLNKGPFHFDGLLRVPSIWRFPGRFPAGVVRDALASHLDFVPTVLGLAGIGCPDGGPLWPAPLAAESPDQLAALPGRSLLPLLNGASERVQDAVVIESDEDYLGLRLRTLVTEAHQLTIYVGEHVEEPYGELFDLHADPGQLHNLWARSEYTALKRELQARLLMELVRTDNRLPRRLTHA
jgi:arylsulfatase